jgi:hypothetical protein
MLWRERRPTSNFELVWIEAIPSLRRSRSCRFINCSHNRAHDNHLDEAADAPVNDQFSGKRLDRVDGEPHADRRNLQQDTKPDSCHYTDACETARVNRHERKNQKRLANNDKVKQGHHFTLRSPEIRRFRVNVLEQDAIQEPTPQEDENVRGDERDDESFHELG